MSLEQGSSAGAPSVVADGEAVGAGRGSGALEDGGRFVDSRRRERRAQRARVLEAMVAIAAEKGFTAASVDYVIKRARVSRRTFYELFDSLEDCFSVALEEALVGNSALISEAFEDKDCWEDGVFGALVALLMLFDSEPLLARAWLIESFTAGSWALELRERSIAALRGLIVERWNTMSHAEPQSGAPDPPEPGSPPIVGTMAAVLGVIERHLVTQQPEWLIMLLGPLMGLVMGTYQDADKVAREIARGEQRANELLAAPYPPSRRGASRKLASELPEALRDPRAHRARLCLLYLLEHPGASNRQIGLGAGIASHTQASTLLRRLFAMGLLLKRPGAPGQANAWSLSKRGARAARMIAESQVDTLRDLL